MNFIKGSLGYIKFSYYYRIDFAVLLSSKAINNHHHNFKGSEQKIIFETPTMWKVEF